MVSADTSFDAASRDGPATMTDTSIASGSPEHETISLIRPDPDVWGAGGRNAGDGALRLDVAQGSIRRALRAIEVMEHLLARDLVDPGGGGDPRLRAAPRRVARLIWLLGFPGEVAADRPEIEPALSRARSAAAEIAEWVAELQAALTPSRVIRVAEVCHEDWVEPEDRLLAFACETAAVALQELCFDLEEAVRDRLSRAA